MEVCHPALCASLEEISCWGNSIDDSLFPIETAFLTCNLSVAVTSLHPAYVFSTATKGKPHMTEWANRKIPPACSLK